MRRSSMRWPVTPGTADRLIARNLNIRLRPVNDTV